jgi:hypothetical protein
LTPLNTPSTVVRRAGSDCRAERLTQPDGNTAEISPALASGMVLDVANGIVRERAVAQLYPRQGSANQRWRFPVDGL